jgi:hypothetical protein
MMRLKKKEKTVSLGKRPCHPKSLSKVWPGQGRKDSNAATGNHYEAVPVVDSTFTR